MFVDCGELKMQVLFAVCTILSSFTDLQDASIHGLHMSTNHLIIKYTVQGSAYYIF